MALRCPFSDDQHRPEGPRHLNSRSALRRHLVIHHGCDLCVDWNGSGQRVDNVVRLSPDALAHRLQVLRRAQRHHSRLENPGSTGGPSASVSSVSVATPITSGVAGSSLCADGGLNHNPARHKPVDLSAGEDLSWSDVEFPDELLELSRPDADAGAATWGTVPAGQWPVVSGQAALVPVGGSVTSSQTSTTTVVDSDVQTEDTQQVADVGTQTERSINWINVAEFVAMRAITDPSAGPLRLVFDSTRLLNLDHSGQELATLAAHSVIFFEQLFVENLVQLAARALLADVSAAGGLFTLAMELELRRGRRQAFEEQPYTADEEAGPMLSLEMAPPPPDTEDE